MHPRHAALVAFCDGESGAAGNRRIARHLTKCTCCQEQLGLIRNEKDELSAAATSLHTDSAAGLAEVLSAMAAWRDGRSNGAASELRRRLRGRIELYCGAAAVSLVERPGMRADELLGKTSQVLEVFLGPMAAEAVRDEVLGGLNWAAPDGEMG
jgi:hypothetical protein